jgi:hypothetical protein
MKKYLAVLGLTMVTAVGCQSGATRSWQAATMPTHDKQIVFDAARSVLKEHFEIAEENWTQGTIETKPQLFDRARTGTLADMRGAGGRWRHTVSVELERDGLDVILKVAVRNEREATAQAIAIAEAGGYEPRVTDVPRSQPMISEPGSAGNKQVWVEVGYDSSLAKEILSEISVRVSKAERGEAAPSAPGESPKEISEETRRFGAQQK